MSGEHHQLRRERSWAAPWASFAASSRCERIQGPLLAGAYAGERVAQMQAESAKGSGLGAPHI